MKEQPRGILSNEKLETKRLITEFKSYQKQKELNMNEFYQPKQI